jgi:hypothetical protein
MKNYTIPVKKRLAALTQAERAAVAKKLGLSFSTVQKIATGETPNPMIDTWIALVKYFGGIYAFPEF